MDFEAGWSEVEPLRALPPGECHVWRVRADRPSEAWRELLTAPEWADLARFHFEADARREAASRAARRVLLGSYLECPPRELRFSAGPHGKPEVAGGSGGGREAVGGRRHEVLFNSSHSGDWALIAIRTGGRVGVDVERRRPMDQGAIANRFFHPEEYRAWRERLPAEMEAEFFRLWTLKEAYIKALGLGLAKPLPSFCVRTGAEGGLASCSDDPQAPARWRLRNLDFEPGYAAAIAVEEPVKRCRTFTLR